MSAAIPPKISGWDEDYLANTKDVVSVLDGQLRIKWTNQRWLEFAAANDGLPAVRDTWSAGAKYTSAISKPLRSFYEQRLQRCLDRQEVWSHDYECSSPGHFRSFHQVVYPVACGWLVIANSLVVEREHDAAFAAGQAYRSEQGMLRQCMHCRRFCHAAENRWDWVPEYVAKLPPDTSHSLCGSCSGFYYPDEPGT
tara:strand:+ start:43587 stop:44174 length:588 start_codon:yes stop_codon:yes gene_type:complete